MIHFYQYFPLATSTCQSFYYVKYVFFIILYHFQRQPASSLIYQSIQTKLMHNTPKSREKDAERWKMMKSILYIRGNEGVLAHL